MPGSERGIQIPVSAIFEEAQDRRNLDQQRLSLISPKFRLVDSTQIWTGKSVHEIADILGRFEKTHQLFSEASVTFPSDETSFPQESLERTAAFGLAQVEVPGFTVVPKLLALAKERKIDEDTFEILWNATVPGVPAPISHTVSKHRQPLVNHAFLTAGLGIHGKSSLVEDDGQTPYSIDFENSHHLLIEDFPVTRPLAMYYYLPLMIDLGAMITDPYPDDSPLLTALKIPRGGFSHRQVLQAIDANGSDVLETLGLDPLAYRIHPIRYEDFLRIGSQRSWQISPFATLLDGWYKRGNKIFSMVAGQNFDAYHEFSSLEGLFRGLSHFDILPDYYYDRRKHDLEKEFLDRREVIIRLAISRRHL